MSLADAGSDYAVIVAVLGLLATPADCQTPKRVALIIGVGSQGDTRSVNGAIVLE
jgi:hypothetical protein